jgi:flagellar biosynthetic protein FliQ
MKADQALQLMNQLLWNSFLIALPILATTLIIGVVISVIQVVTQVQEMSLSYVPKLIAALVVLIVMGPWMLNRLTSFAVALFSGIPNLGS